jgi:hypothetical protein
MCFWKWEKCCYMSIVQSIQGWISYYATFFFFIWCLLYALYYRHITTLFPLPETHSLSRKFFSTYNSNSCIAVFILNVHNVHFILTLLGDYEHVILLTNGIHTVFLTFVNVCVCVCVCVF